MGERASEHMLKAVKLLVTTENRQEEKFTFT